MGEEVSGFPLLPKSISTNPPTHTESNAMKNMISILSIAIAILQGCDVTEVPEEHRATADSLIRADSIRRADSLAALPVVRSHTWKVCVQGEDKTGAMEWEDPRFWGALKLRIGRDTVTTPDLHSLECMDLGALSDTTALQVLTSSTATRFEAAWLQADTVATKYYLPWRQVRLHPDSLRAVSDSIWIVGSRSMNKSHQVGK